MFKSIQGCRALAALLVVLHHLGRAMASDKYFGERLIAVPFVAGDAGVEFFFVLSGFIITWAHFGDFGRPARVSGYLRKRFARIYPVYWIVFAALHLFAQASPTLRATVPHDYPTLLASLALAPQDPAAVGWNGSPVVAVAWSLQYEVCFYALIALFIVSRTLGLLASIPLMANFGACHVSACSFPRSFFANNLILLFGLGVAVAYCVKRSIRMRRPLIVAAMAATGFASYGALEATVGTDALGIDRRIVYGLLSGLVIFGLAQSESSGELRLRNRSMSLLGDSSYALYLLHYPMISALCKLMILIGLAGGFGAAVAYPVILCACIAVSVGFHRWVEKPLLRALYGRAAAATPVHEVS
jgi:peptidoglycan/LPS O-acetylase OafA/YrhL